MLLRVYLYIHGARCGGWAANYLKLPRVVYHIYAGNVCVMCCNVWCQRATTCYYKFLVN